jgi:hypothetical protein
MVTPERWGAWNDGGPGDGRWGVTGCRVASDLPTQIVEKPESTERPAYVGAYRIDVAKWFLTDEGA